MALKFENMKILQNLEKRPENLKILKVEKSQNFPKSLQNSRNLKNDVRNPQIVKMAKNLPNDTENFRNRENLKVVSKIEKY